MALDPEEFKRRRQEREALRQQKEKDNNEINCSSFSALSNSSLITRKDHAEL